MIALKMFQHFTKKKLRKKRESVAGAISGATEALMKFVDKQSPAVNPKTPANSEASTCSSGSVGISPAKAADIFKDYMKVTF